MPAAVTFTSALDLTGIERDLNAFSRRVPAIKLRIDTDGFTNPLGKITSNLSEFDRSLAASNARVFAFGASAGIIYSVQKAFSELVSATIEVEKSLTDINVLLNVSQTKLQSFSNGLFDVARDTGQSFREVAKAATEFARQGLGIEETLKRTRDALVLSRLSGLDTIASVEAQTAALNSFNKTLLDSATLTSKYAAVDASFAVSAADLAEAVKRVGSSAQDAGVGLDQLLGIVTAVQQTTSRGGAVIGNALKSIFTRLERSGTIEQLQALGVEINNTQNGVQKLQALSDAIKKADTGTANTIKELAGGVFQINVVSAALQDLGKSYGLVANATKIAANATNEAETRNTALNQTLAASFNKAKENFRQLSSTVGSSVVSPTASTLLTAVNNGLGAINSADNKGIGAGIGKSILEGLGQFLGGPGLAIVILSFTKIFSRFRGDVKEAVSSVLGLNAAAKEQQLLQAQIAQTLNSRPELIQKIYSGEISLLDAEKSILSTLTQQNNEREKANRFVAGLARNIQASGGLPKSPTGVIADSLINRQISPRLFIDRSNPYDDGLSSKSVKPILAPDAISFINKRLQTVLDVALEKGKAASGDIAGIAKSIYATDDYKNSSASIRSQLRKFVSENKKKGIAEFERAMAEAAEISDLEQKAGGLFGGSARSTLASRGGPEDLAALARGTGKFNSKIQGIGFGASIIVPVITSAIADNVFNGDAKSDRVGKAVSNAVGETASYAGLGAVAGSFFPGVGTLAGLGAGAAIGGTFGLVKVFSEFSDNLPEFESRLKKSSQALSETSDTLSSLLSVIDKLKGVASGDIKATPHQLVELREQRNNFLAKLNPSDRSSFQKALESDDSGQITDTVSKILKSQSAETISKTFAAGIVEFSQSSLSKDRSKDISKVINELLVIPTEGGPNVRESLTQNKPLRDSIIKGIEDSFTSTTVPGVSNFLGTSPATKSTTFDIDKFLSTLKKTGVSSDAFSDIDAGVRSASKNPQNLQSLIVNLLEILRKTIPQDKAAQDELDKAIKRIVDDFSGLRDKIRSTTQGIEDAGVRLKFQNTQRQLGIKGESDLFQATGKGIVDLSKGVSGPLGINDLEELIKKQEIASSFRLNSASAQGNFSEIILKKLEDFTTNLNPTALDKENALPRILKLVEDIKSSAGNPEQVAAIVAGFHQDQAARGSSQAGINSELVKKSLDPLFREIDTGQKTLDNTLKNLETETKIQTQVLERQVLIQQLVLEQQKRISFGGGIGVDTGNQIDTFVGGLKSRSTAFKTSNPNFAAKGNLDLAEILNSFGLSGAFEGDIKNDIKRSLKTRADIFGVKLDEGKLDQVASDQYNAKFQPDKPIEELKKAFDSFSATIQTNDSPLYKAFYAEDTPLIAALKGKAVVLDSKGKDPSFDLNVLSRKFAEQDMSPAERILARANRRLNRGLRDYGASNDTGIDQDTTVQAGFAGASPDTDAIAQNFGRGIKSREYLTSGFNYPKYYEALKKLQNFRNANTRSTSQEALDKFNDGTIFADEFNNTRLTGRNQRILDKDSSYNPIKESFNSFRDSLAYKNQDFFKDLQEGAAELGKTMKSSFSDAFKSFIDGSKNAKEAFKSFGISVLQKISDIVSNSAINSLFGGLGNLLGGSTGASLGSLFTSKSTGGIIGYSGGGLVSGGTGTKDDVPAVLGNGDFVISKRAVQTYGVDALSRLTTDRDAGIKTRTSGNSIVLANNFGFNDRIRPTGGFFNVDSNLSSLALTDENNPQNARKFGRESEFIQYLRDKEAYDLNKKNALKQFRQGQDQRLIGAYISAATQIAGGALRSGGVGGAQGVNGSTNINYNGNNIKLRGIGIDSGSNFSNYSNYAATGGLATNGGFKYYAGGGQNSGDNIPAMLTGGEYVVKKAVVDKYGVNFFKRLNNTTLDVKKVRGYSDGGLVGTSSAVGDSNDRLLAAIEKLVQITTVKTPPNVQSGTDNTASGTINNQFYFTTNIDSSGKTTTDSKSKSNQDQPVDQRKQADLLHGMIIKVITEQQRPGGLLRP